MVLTFKRSEVVAKDYAAMLLDFAKKQEYKRVNRNLITWWGVSPIGLEKPIENEPLLAQLKEEVDPDANSICILKYIQGLRGCDRIDEEGDRTIQLTLIDYDERQFEEPPTIQMVWDGKALKDLNHGEISSLSTGIYYSFLNHHDHYQIQFKRVEFNLYQQKLELHRRINALTAEQTEKVLELTNKFRH